MTRIVAAGEENSDRFDGIVQGFADYVPIGTAALDGWLLAGH
jgi:hypothetical protein